MKRLRTLYLLALPLLMALGGCTADDAERGQDTPDTPAQNGNKVTVHLHISQAGTSQTRADAHAKGEEMMNTWTVVVTSTDGKVQMIRACRPSGDSREEDDLFDIEKGTYNFYSFANIAPKVVMHLLGIPEPSSARTRPDGSNDPTTNTPTDPFSANDSISTIDSAYYSNYANSDPIANAAENEVQEYVFAEGATVDYDKAQNIVAGITAEGADSTNIGTHKNSFGGTGIPMSNFQQLTIPETGEVDLVVVRAYAKMELHIYNETGDDFSVKSVKLSDITRSQPNNYKLFPALADRNTVENGGVTPNLNTTYTANFKYSPSTALSVPKDNTVGSGKYTTLVFYTNESATPKNLFERFFIELEIADGAGNVKAYRYAMIDGDNKWDHISRNDYRVLPLVIDDYVLDMDILDFPAIGVYPAAKSGDAGLYTYTLYDYGHFHLMPTVKTSGGAKVDYSSTTPSAPYASTTWGNLSLAGPYADSSKASFDNSTSNFFVDANSTVTSADDGSENGGFPVFDTTSLTSDAPFIFGKTQKNDSGADKRVYYELSAELYKEGASAPRSMKLRFYLIADKSQQSLARRR